MVAAVVDGLYGNDNICQYIHPFLCLIIRPLNQLLPTADVFSFLIHIGLFFQIGLIASFGFARVTNRPLRIWGIQEYLTCLMAILLVAFLSAGIVIWNVNYTVQTAFFVFTGSMALFLALERSKGTAWIIIGTILIAFGFLLRMEAALLFLPFLLLEMLTFLLEEQQSENKENWKKIQKYLHPAALVIAVLLLGRTAFYSVEPYKTAARYNKARTTCIDYPMKSYSNLKDPSGILPEDYNAATNWVYADTDILNVDYLEQIAAAGEKNEYSLSGEGFVQTLEKMWFRLTQTNLYLFMMFITSAILLVRNLFLCQTKCRKLESILAFLGGFIILAYFTFRGRAPTQVWEPVLFATDFVLICAALKHPEKKPSDRWLRAELAFQILICVSLWFSVGQVMSHNQWHMPASVLTSKINADDSVYQETFENDGLYLWPTWHMRIPRYFCEIDKLPTKRVLEHNIPVGDWIYGQPYFGEMLERIDVPNLAVALLERPNTYLMNSPDNLLRFLRAHYGKDIDVEEAGEINEVMTYRVVENANLR